MSGGLGRCVGVIARARVSSVFSMFSLCTNCFCVVPLGGGVGFGWWWRHSAWAVEGGGVFWASMLLWTTRNRFYPGFPITSISSLGLWSVLHGFFMVQQHCVILNWNVGGLNNSVRRKVVCDLVRETKATIVTLQETKLDVIDAEMVNEILGSRFVDNYVVLPALGTRGGILLAVDDSHYKIMSAEVGVHTVTAVVSTCQDTEQWCITAVYGPQGDAEKI